MKMKFAVAVMGLLMACAGAARAVQNVSTNLANETGLAYNNNYTLNVSTYPNAQSGIGRLSAQIIYSSLTANAATYNGGRTSTATITVANNNLLSGVASTNTITVPTDATITGAAARARITVTSNANLGAGATSQLNILSNTGLTGTSILVTGVGSAQLINGRDWLTGLVSSDTAVNLTTALNAVSSVTGIVAIRSGTQSVIYTTSSLNGAAGRSYSITSTNGNVSTNTFSGGQDNAIININGNLLINQTHWNVGLVSSNTAVNIKNAINTYLGSQLVAGQTAAQNIVYTTATVLGTAYNNTLFISSPSASLTPNATFYSGGANRGLLGAAFTLNGIAFRNGYEWTDSTDLSTMTAVSIQQALNPYAATIVSTAASSVVYATATLKGTAGNAFTLASNNTNLTVGGATFSNGQDTATITINGITLTAGTQGSGSFAIGANAGATAINISSAIRNTPSLAAIALSTTTAAQSVVYATSTADGVAANYVNSTNSSGLTVTSFSAGADPANVINTAVISIPSHGFTTGFQVLLTTGSALRLAPLNWGTTYYAIRVDANNIALATSLTNAVAGSSITITSSSTLTTVPSFTLTPLGIAGGASWKWQVSNDGLNWTDLATPAPYTVGTFVFPSTSTVVDFGEVDYQQIRMNVTAPTAGGVGLKVPVQGRL